MSSPFVNNLIQFAYTDLPSLEFDLQNAQSIYTLNAAVSKMFNMVSYLIHHALVDAGVHPNFPQAPAHHPQHSAPVYQHTVAPQPAQAPVVQRAPVFAGPPYPAVPGMPMVQQQQPQARVAAMPMPGGGGPAAPGNTDNSRTTEVFVTQGGTRIIPPGARTAVDLPAGSHVDLTQFVPPPPGQMLQAPQMQPAPVYQSPVPQQLPQDGTGPAEVIVSPGMTPEVAAALQVAKTVPYSGT